MSPTNFLIPLSNTPQQFEIPLAGVVYTMVCKWNDQEQSWIFDIADSNNNPIVANIPLVTGVDLLDGLAYLGIGGSLFVLTNGSNPFDVPTLNNLGVDSNVYFQTSVTNE